MSELLHEDKLKAFTEKYGLEVTIYEIVVGEVIPPGQVFFSLSEDDHSSCVTPLDLEGKELSGNTLAWVVEGPFLTFLCAYLGFDVLTDNSNWLKIFERMNITPSTHGYGFLSFTFDSEDEAAVALILSLSKSSKQFHPKRFETPAPELP